MVTINASSLRATLNDAAAAPAAGSNSSSDPAGFSSLLRQSQAAATPAAAVAPRRSAPATHDDAVTRSADRTPDAEPAHPAEHDTEASSDADAAVANDLANRTRTLLKPKSHGDSAPRAAKPAAEATGSDAKLAGKVATDASAKAGAASTTSAPLDPNLAQWLAALQSPASATKTADGTPAATDAAASTLVDANASTKPARADAIGADPKDKIGSSQSRFAAAADAAGLAAARVETHAAQAAAPSATQSLSIADGVLAASLQTTPTSLREAAAPTSVAIPTPVNAPDFAQTLGMQLSVFAKDGVQHAELHLNPAEMGPVSVQIVMDGTQARIDFGADVAATRRAIEAGLPELASALRDAGFTLAGGGVSQHSGGRGDSSQPGNGQAQRSPISASEDSVARVSNAARHIVANGGVDLYA